MIIYKDIDKEKYNIIKSIDLSMNKVDEDFKNEYDLYSNIWKGNLDTVGKNLKKAGLMYCLISSSERPKIKSIPKFKVNDTLGLTICKWLFKKKEVADLLSDIRLDKNGYIHIEANDPYTIIIIGIVKLSDNMDPNNFNYKAVLVNSMVKKSWFDYINKDSEKYYFNFSKEGI